MGTISSSTVCSSAGSIEFVGARPKRKRNFKLRKRRGDGVDALAGWFEPAGKLGDSKGLSWSGSKQVRSECCGLPDTRFPRCDGGDEERAAVSVQRQARLVGFLLQAERDQIAQRALIAMMSPGEVSGGGIESRKCLPIPGSGTDGAGEEVAQTGGAQSRPLTGRHAARLHVGADEIDDIVHCGARLKDGGHAESA